MKNRFTQKATLHTSSAVLFLISYIYLVTSIKRGKAMESFICGLGVLKN